MYTKMQNCTTTLHLDLFTLFLKHAHTVTTKHGLHVLTARVFSFSQAYRNVSTLSVSSLATWIWNLCKSAYDSCNQERDNRALD